jgi:predicted GIY-YIG superfamily endonuclease
MLRCRDGSYYIGVTSEIEVRVAKHALGVDPDAYTFRRRPVTVVYSEVFSTPDEAIYVEKRLKGWSRAKKAALVRGDWNVIGELSRSCRSSREIVAHPSTSSG